jgi:hypothetical protein
MATLPSVVDVAELERKFKDMSTRVALDPESGFHFEMGRTMALWLGYADAELAAVPPEAIQSFAGVGRYFEVTGAHGGFQMAVAAFPAAVAFTCTGKEVRPRQVFHDGGTIPMSVDSGGRS